MYVIDNQRKSDPSYTGSVKKIAEVFGAPYRRMLTQLNKWGMTYFWYKGELYVVKKIKQL